MSRLRVVRTRAELREALALPRTSGQTIGLVPTMGSLHDGHAALLRAARERSDVVVMSLFVNPAQFGPGEDLAAYPRDEAGDLALAAERGVDLAYAPSVDEVYPDGFATTVTVDAALTGVLCGAPERRGPGHFRGVTTVVAKLLAIVDPDLAFFGQKDAQQAAIVTRMARDLDFRAQIVVVPTVRDSDGLALSSRNAYLSAAERRRATALHAALERVRAEVRDGRTETVAALAPAHELLRSAGIEPEYLEARHADDLTPAASFNGRPILVALAARVGRARLIDNVIITPTAGNPGP